MRQHTYEPDPPHTPRIAAILSITPVPTLEIATVRKRVLSDLSTHCFYCYDYIPKGLGYCLTTYAGDGNPPPTYRGEPFLLPLEGNITTIAETFWNTLNAEHRVSIAVKFICPGFKESTIKIINRHE